MSTIDKELTNAAVIPVIESNIFDENPEAKFAVGILAVADQAVLGLEREYRGYYDLRRKVYVDQTGQLSPEDVNPDGTDRDSDDARSVAFGVIENRGVDQRVVGALRLIIKGMGAEIDDSDRELPVEEFCPEVFEQPGGDRTTEVSRLISRYEQPRMQDLITWKLYSAGLTYIKNNKLGPTYAVVEPHFERHLNGTIPISRIGEPRFIEHYLDVNVPIEVHTDDFIDLVKQKYPGTIEELDAADGAMTFFGKLRRPQNTDSAA